MKIERLTGQQIYYGVLAGAKRLINNRQLLNKINVFPVPDGDTGSNLASLMKTIVQEIKLQNSSPQIMNQVAEAALKGARGNSGIIFAQFLNGLAVELKSEQQISVTNFSESVNRAVPYVYQAVSNPVEGTMITVIRDWAEAVNELKASTDDFKELFAQSIKAAETSLQNTALKLDALKQAQVVDAGGKGFVNFLEGIRDFLVGKEEITQIQEVMSTTEVETADYHSEKIKSPGAIEFRYCTEILAEDLQFPLAEIRSKLEDYGDSLVLAGTKKQLRLHIHTNQPEEVVYNLSRWGTVIEQKVDDMEKQAAVVNSRQQKVALVTDSIADLPQELIDDYQIQVIPLHLSVAGNNYLDKLTVTPDKFYSLLAEAEIAASSSQPSLKQVDNLFSFLSSHYQSILVITVAQELSGTWNVVRQVANRYQEKDVDIELINSKLNSGAQGLVVLEAAEMIADGWPQEEIVKQIKELIGRTEIFVSVDTLEYMVRGGRLSRPAGWLGKLVNLKPIISLDETGAGTIAAKAFSKRGVKKKIKQIVADRKQKTGIQRYCIVHAQARSQAETYARELTELTGQPPAYMMEISPVVGLHSGPGSTAVALIKEG